MAKKRKRYRVWKLLFKVENGQAVHLYEPLSFGEINCRLQQGWKVIE
jgi:hypothetical protein